MDNFDFDKLITQANGMLPASVYAEIAKIASRVTSDILEVGTAHGASAIAAAIGINPQYLVKTIDKLQGGSRASYGDVEDNKSIVLANLKNFGVEDKVELYVGSSEEVADKLEFNNGIGMLILDADGAIDRDFGLFYNQLLPGAPIIIDDYRPNYITITRSVGGDCQIDQKHRLTTLLVEYFESKGLLQRERILKDTYIGTKPLVIDANVTIDLNEVLQVYRKLTFVKGKSKALVLSKTLTKLKRNAPKVHLVLKKMFRPSRT